MASKRNPFQKLSKAIDKEIRSKKFLKGLADKGAVLIRVRTRLGYSVEKFNGPRTKLEKLALSTKKIRKKFKSLASTTTKTKSNLTFTGKMLDSIKAKTSGRKAIIFISNKNRAEVAEYHEEGTDKMPARPFMHLGRIEVKELRRDVRERIRKILK